MGNNSLVASDIKPKEYWFQDYDEVENHYSMDMKEINNCRSVTFDYVFNMACNMGGMGFIENNKADVCSQKINTNLLIACKDNGIKRYFFLLVHVHIIKKNKKMYLYLKKNDALEDGYGWENYLVNECADTLWIWN